MDVFLQTELILKRFLSQKGNERRVVSFTCRDPQSRGVYATLRAVMRLI